MSMRDRTNADDSVSETVEDVDPKAVHEDGEVHATTGGAALAGAGTGATIGAITGGPIGAAIGAVGGAIVGAISERVMHSDNDAEHDATSSADYDTAPTTTRTSTTTLHDRDLDVGVGSAAAYAPAVAAASSLRTADVDVDVDRRRDVDVDVSRGSTVRRAEAGETIQLREEELVANKRMVEAGEVEIRKDVVSEERSVEVPVMREEVVIERRAVDRRPTDAIRGTEAEVIEVPVREEAVAFDKRVVVAEEVAIGKRAVTETERATETVRREVLEVETEGDVNVGGDRGTTTRASETRRLDSDRR